MWKSNGIWEESIENITTSGSTFTPTLIETRPLPVGKFNGICLIRNNVYNFRKVINLYITYTLDTSSKDLNTDFTLNSCLFGFVNLIKNADPDKYKYSWYRIGFDSYSEFSLIDCSVGRNIIIFGVDTSSSVQIDNKKYRYLKS